MPMVNSSKITPISAAACTASPLATRPSCAGPINTPAARKPTIGTTRTLVMTNPMTAAVTISTATGPRNAGGAWPAAETAASTDISGGLRARGCADASGRSQNP